MQAANDNRPGGASIRFVVEPRLVPPAKAARRLHLSPDEFNRQRPEFRRHGFPSPCPVTGNFDLVAIDRWIDAQSGIAPESMTTPSDATSIVNARLASLG